MAITVRESVRKGIRGDPSSILIQVQKSSDPERAETALGEARLEIAELDGGWESAPNLNEGDRNGPKYLSKVAKTPTGPVLYIDGGYTPDELLATIPEIITRHLADAGVTSAVIATPSTDGPFDDLHEVPRAIIMYLYLPPPPLGALRGSRTTIPFEWLEKASAWLTEGLPPDGQVWTSAMVQFPVGGSDALELLERPREGIVRLMASDPTTQVRALHATFIGYQYLALAGGGPEATDDQLIETMESLIGLARELAPTLGYALVTPWPTFNGLNSLTRAKGLAVQELVVKLCDEIILDGFHYQILGSGHTNRLIYPESLLPSIQLEPFLEGRVGVRVGDASDWLIDRPLPPGMPQSSAELGLHRRNPEIQGLARQILAPLIVTDEEARVRMRVRRESSHTST
jgi:hypothetical protein